MNVKTEENLAHLGADLPRELIQEWRRIAASEQYKKKALLQRFAEWWISLDKDARKNFYHGGDPIPSGSVMRQIVSEVIDEYESRRQSNARPLEAKSAKIP